MKAKAIYKVLEVILLLLGVLFIINSRANIIGAVIGVPRLPSAVSSAIGFYLLILSLVLFLAEKLEQRVKYDSNVKSFRRWLEKKENRKIGYEEAENIYSSAEQHYWKKLGEGSVKKGYESQPLKFIEDYIDSAKEQYKIEKEPITLKNKDNNYSIEGESESREKIIRTPNFEQSIKGYSLKEINNAISKIGTGLGKEHKLKGRLKGLLAIRTSKGRRIIFKRENDAVYLENYLSDHDLYNQLAV